MPDDPSTHSDPRIETGSRSSELPQEAHLRKRFGKFQDFIDMYRSRISLGGAFVDNQVLHPVGAEVYLDFRLEDGYRLRLTYTVTDPALLEEPVSETLHYARVHDFEFADEPPCDVATARRHLDYE